MNNDNINDNKDNILVIKIMIIINYLGRFIRKSAKANKETSLTKI